MILKSPTSRTAIVNLFADFILSKIPQNKHSIIQVADCINFFVIKGKTSYGDLLNIFSHFIAMNTPSIIATLHGVGPNEVT